MLPLDCGAEFDPAREEGFFATVPPRPAVFLLEMRAQPGMRAEPYLGRTADLRRRLERLLRLPAEPTKRLNLREVAARVRYRLTGSAFEQSVVFYHHARQQFGRRARDVSRLRAPALLKVNLSNAYPRCYVTRRIFPDGAFYYGPFPSRRAADNFAAEFLNLFKIRRCQIKIRRDPAFPGCIYSEMKMCLAPCFAGCSKPEYDVEVARVTGFLASGGATHTAELERERETASVAMDFERASAVHRKLEKVSHILRSLPELPRKLDELDAVVLQTAAEPGSIAMFAVHGGVLAEPFFLRFGELASQPRSVEELLRENLKPPMDADEHRLETGSDERADHLSLLARWFYSKPRQGEIFFRARDWPFRRIIRACSRLLTGQQSDLALDTKPETTDEHR